MTFKLKIFIYADTYILAESQEAAKKEFEGIIQPDPGDEFGQGLVDHFFAGVEEHDIDVIQDNHGIYEEIQPGLIKVDNKCYVGIVEEDKS